MSKVSLALILCGICLCNAETTVGIESALKPSVTLDHESACVRLSDQCEVSVSLTSPLFLVDDVRVGGRVGTVPVGGRVSARDPLEVCYAPCALEGGGSLEVRLYVQWSPKEGVLRKWARLRLTDSDKSRLLKEVVLESLVLGSPGVPNDTRPVGDPPQSYPAFLPGLFVGIEFPVASTRLQNGCLVLAHRPGYWLEPEAWYETRKAVYGISPRGGERVAFQRYIASHRPGPRGLHLNYNSWWTSPVPYSERDILQLMQIFEKNLYRAHHVSMDTFCVDMGWSNPRSLWEIDEKLFPEGFAPLQEAAARMGSRLGVWVSPSSHYPPALDNEWAEEQGYETFQVPRIGHQKIRLACLGGQRYRQAFRDRLVEMEVGDGARHFKFDGIHLACPETDHGHAPGDLSCEAIAKGIISVFEDLRRAAPDVWMETTCFGWNPSPWWLFYVNSVIGTFGDDAPSGRVPAPVYRESYTTSRDYYNLQGAHWLPVPISAQEVLGIIHQSPEPFTNDAVMTMMRGHGFLPIYLNPDFMTSARWETLADLLKWARKNADLLAETVPLLPTSWTGGRCPRFASDPFMPREPYGYAHWKGKHGLLALRNPWILPRSYTLVLDATFGVPTDARSLAVHALYPEVRVYGRGLEYGEALSVPLAPYETLVLAVEPSRKGKVAPETEARRLIVRGAQPSVEHVDFAGPEPAYGPDYTSLVGETTQAVEIHGRWDVEVAAPESELLVLLEGNSWPAAPMYKVRINNVDTAVAVNGSETGWYASSLPPQEQWLFLRCPVPPGKSQVSLELLIDGKVSTVSGWLWAKKRGGGKNSGHRNALPQPEEISLDAAALMPTLDVGSPPQELVRKPRPVERIEGVYLDTLEPVSASQGWGALQRNKSVWERPMTIAGKRFQRGLGTHAPSIITYDIAGRYRRFQAWAGADGATNPSVTFEVRVDGASRWQSGLMKREDPAQQVDLDVTGAKTLELIVGDGGNGIVADHADWGEAKMLY